MGRLSAMGMDDDSLAPALEILVTDNLEVSCEAERYKGSPLLDTTVIIKGEACISWKDRETLAQELQDVLDKFKI